MESICLQCSLLQLFVRICINPTLTLWYANVIELSAVEMNKFDGWYDQSFEKLVNFFNSHAKCQTNRLFGAPTKISVASCSSHSQTSSWKISLHFSQISEIVASTLQLFNSEFYETIDYEHIRESFEACTMSADFASLKDFF